MCGIAGIVRTDGREVRRSEVFEFAARMSHRGPDGEGTHVSGPVGLAHRRLAIISPETGRQPLSNEDGTVWVTFNGEIYNYRQLRVELRARGHLFRTDSDTEVLVHGWEEWRENLPCRLRGMFAFGIWDERAKRLCLARDRLGIKPLFYGEGRGIVGFASELQAFHAVPEIPRAVDPRAIDLYLHFQYIPAPLTVFRDIRKLPPGHLVVLDESGRGTPRRYWEVRFEPERGGREARWLEELEATLSEAVACHLVSDVPFGAFLSGGVDSSTVVGLMTRHLRSPARTFSIGFSEREYDETPWARQAAKTFGTVHEERQVQAEGLHLMPTLVRHYGEPFGDSSAVPTWEVSRLAASKLKMVLSGDGGDELFAGYLSYAGLLNSHRQPNGRLRRVRFALGSIARSAGLRPPLPRPERTWFDAIAYFDEAARSRLWRPEWTSGVRTSWEWFETEAGRHRAPDLCSRFQSVDLATYLPNDILMKVDVASMAHGLEVRVPLLDHRVVELAARVPVKLKIRAIPGAGGRQEYEGKVLLKQLAARMLGKDFVGRKKQGFSAPLGSWFRAVPRGDLEERLASPRSRLSDYLRPSEVARYVRENAEGRDHGFRLWALAFLEEFLRQEAEQQVGAAEVK